MNIFSFLKLLGHGFISSQVKHALDHNLSAVGKAKLATSLLGAGQALTANPPDTETAAGDITDVLFSIH